MSSHGLRFLLDQNVPCAVAEWLRALRPTWTVYHTSEVGLDGMPDRNVFDWAQGRGAVVITYDEDFADRRLFPLGQHHGVIRLRVWPTTIEETQAGLARLLECIPDEDIPGSLIIIDSSRIRVRRRQR